MMISGKRILLGVTGGIAAYKALILIRLLRKEGAEVRVALTLSGEKMVGRASFEAIAGYPVLQGAFEMERGSITHIEAARWADLLLIYPCTANTAAKLANGFADEMLSLIALATRAPRLIFPSMNEAMWEHPAFQRNLLQLERDGAQIISPANGEMACGESGQGRLPEPEEALEWCIDALAPEKMVGTVTIALGRTEERIDPVRVVTNRSSGKTGLALVHAFRLAGWKVNVVAGPTDTPLPAWSNPLRVSTALEMRTAVEERFAHSDLLVMAAAVADFRPASPALEKMKRSRDAVSLDLLPNPDILAELSRSKRADQRVVGFALETESLLENAEKKLREKGCDLLVANNPTKAGSGFDHDEVEWGILSSKGVLVEPAIRPKWELASTLAKLCTQLRCGEMNS